MDCRRVRRLREAYVDGLLSAEVKGRVEAHLAECPACRAEIERSRLLVAEIRSTFRQALGEPTLPPHVEAQIRARLDRDRRPAGAGLQGRWVPALASLLLVLAVALTLNALFQSLDRRKLPAASPSPVPTSSPWPSPTQTVSATVPASPTVLPSVTPAPLLSPSPSFIGATPESPTPTGAPGSVLPPTAPSPLPTPSPRREGAGRPSATPTVPAALLTGTPLRSASPTPTGLPASPSPTPSPTLTFTPPPQTVAPTLTPGPTGSPSPGPTPSPTPTASPVPTATPRPTETPPPTATATATATVTPSPSPTPSPTPTATDPPTATPTATLPPLFLLVDPVTSPTEQTTQIVTGRTGPEFLVEIVCQNEDAWCVGWGETNASGYFAVAVELTPNTANHLLVTAWDPVAGGEISTTVDLNGAPLVIVQSSGAPALFLEVDPVTSPTARLTQTVTGRTLPAAWVDIECAGDEVWCGGWDEADANGYFAVEVDLEPDALNALIVSVTDVEGEETISTTVDINGQPLVIEQRGGP